MSPAAFPTTTATTVPCYDYTDIVAPTTTPSSSTTTTETTTTTGSQSYYPQQSQSQQAQQSQSPYPTTPTKPPLEYHPQQGQIIPPSQQQFLNPDETLHVSRLYKVLSKLSFFRKTSTSFNQSQNQQALTMPPHKQHYAQPSSTTTPNKRRGGAVFYVRGEGSTVASSSGSPDSWGSSSNHGNAGSSYHNHGGRQDGSFHQNNDNDLPQPQFESPTVFFSSSTMMQNHNTSYCADEEEEEMWLLPPSNKNKNHPTPSNIHIDDPIETRSWASFPFEFPQDDDARDDENEHDNAIKDADMGLDDILDEIEELSQALSGSYAVPSGDNDDSDNDQDVSPQDVAATLQQDLPVWWRVRQRFRRLFARNNNTASAKNVATTKPTGNANHLPTTPDTVMTSEDRNDTPIDNKEDDNGMFLSLQLNHEEDGVEVEWPQMSFNDDDRPRVDVSRVREQHHRASTKMEESQRDAEAATDTVDLSNVNSSLHHSFEDQDATLSVTMDPKDKCVQLVLVRSKEKKKRLPFLSSTTPTETETLPTQEEEEQPKEKPAAPQEESGLGSSTWGEPLEEEEEEEEEISSLMLNDFALGATFPFTHADQEEDERQANRHELDNTSAPTYFRSKVEYPTRTRPIVGATTQWDFPLHKNTKSSTAGQEEEPKKGSRLEPRPPLRPPSMAGSAIDSKASVSHLSPIPMEESFSCDHPRPERVKSSDSLWSDLEEQNRAPFDEPLHHEETSAVDEQLRDTVASTKQEEGRPDSNFLGIMDDRWFHDILQFSQQEICATRNGGGGSGEAESISSIPRSIPMEKDQDTLETSVISMPESLSSSFQQHHNNQHLQQQSHKQSHTHFVSPTTFSSSRQQLRQQQWQDQLPSVDEQNYHPINRMRVDKARQSSGVESMATSAWSPLDALSAPMSDRNEETRVPPPDVVNHHHPTPEISNKKSMNNSNVSDDSNPSILLSEFDPTDIDNYASAAAESATYEKQDNGNNPHNGSYACYPYGNDSTVTGDSSQSSSAASHRRRRRTRH